MALCKRLVLVLHGYEEGTSYFWLMNLSQEHQVLVDFFSGRELPSGPQHVNDYSVFLHLPAAVNTQLQQLNSEVLATRNAAAILLSEVQAWLLKQETV